MGRFDNPKRDSTIHFAPVTLLLGINRCVMPIAMWRFGLRSEALPDVLRERSLTLLADYGADEYRAKVIGPESQAMQGYASYHAVLTEVPDA